MRGCIRRRRHAQRDGCIDVDDLDDGATFEDLADLFCVPLFGCRSLGGRARKGFPECAAELAEDCLARDRGGGGLLL